MLHAFVIHDQHDEIHRFSTKLESPAAAGDRDGSWCAPTGTGAAGCNTLAVPGSNDEASLDHRRHNCHTLGVFKNVTWDSLVWRRHDLVKDVGSRVDALHLFRRVIFAVFRVDRDAHGAKQYTNCSQFSE